MYYDLQQYLTDQHIHDLFCPLIASAYTWFQMIDNENMHYINNFTNENCKTSLV